LSLVPGDTVIYSSRQIPGNEPAITRIQDMIVRRGINLITDDDHPVHVSGHPARDELVEMYALIRPKIAVPVHGTARHLMAHAKLAEACQVSQTLIPNNGDIITFTEGEADITGNVPVGALTHEGGEIVDIQSDFLRSRRRMLWNGAITASVVLTASGELVLAPQVSQSGICGADQADELLADASLRIEDAIDNLSDTDVLVDDAVQQVVISAMRSLVRTRFRLRPTVHVHIMRSDDKELSA
jgi:ribonuclease J